MKKVNEIWDLLINRILFTAVEWFCRAMLGLQAAICIIIFIGRYFFHYTPPWGESAAMMCLVWLCILSSSLAIRDDTHLRMTVLDEVLPKGVLLALDMLASTVILCFAVFMVYAGTGLFKMSTRNMITGLNIPFCWMNLSMPVTGVVYVFSIIEHWRRRIVRCQ